MTEWRGVRPGAAEYQEYFGPYVGLVPEGDVLEAFRSGIRETTGILAGLGDDRGGYRYAEGKWSVKEVVGHLLDCERIFVARALRIARGDGTPLPGFDQDPYVDNGGFARRGLSSLAEEFAIVRSGTIAFFDGLDEDAWERRGTVSGSEMSVRAVAWVIAGHEIHHVGVLKERYL